MSSIKSIVSQTVVATLALACGPTAQAAEFSEKDGVVVFSTPSENVECRYFGKPSATRALEDGAPRLSCDRANPTYVRVIIGGAKGNVTRRDNPSDQTCCSAEHVLGYGARWQGGPFTCLSAKEGISCRHAGGHGLFMGLKAIRTN